MHAVSQGPNVTAQTIPNGQDLREIETWTTRAGDLALADELFSQYVSPDKQDFPLIESWMFSENDNGLYIQFPAWLDELSQRFNRIHGELISPFILSYVMDELLQTLEAKGQITQDTVSFVRGITLMKYHRLTSKFH